MVEESVTLRVALVAALLAALLIALAFLPKPEPEPLGTVDAERLALNDARLAYPTAELRVLESKTLEQGRWRVRVKISLAAHTACPTVRIREYELLPIFFREEEVVRECRAGTGPIVYEEEALVRSLESPIAREAANLNHYGCAIRSSELYKLPGECEASRALLSGIAPRLSQGSWLVAWVPQPSRKAGGIVGVGLDSQGRVLFVEQAPV